MSVPSTTNYYDINPEATIFIEPEYDKKGYLLANKEIVDHLLNHIVPVEGKRRELDASIKDYDHFTLNHTDIERCLSKFNRNFGEMCDGNRVRLYGTDNEEFFKFNANIVISVDDGVEKVPKENLYKMTSLRDHCNNKFPTLAVYLNGKKIPDARVYIYMGKTSTDILIPYSYLAKSETNGKYVDMEFFIEKRVYKKYNYINKFVESVYNGEVTIEFDEKEIHEDPNSLIHYAVRNDRNIMVYSDGMLLYTGISKRWINDKTLIIRFSADFKSHDIEVIVDSDIKVIRTNQVIGETLNGGKAYGRSYFNLLEKDINYYIDYIYGPIPKENCYFFLNGIRIPNDDVNQVGRMNFTYDSSKDLGAHFCTLVYTDRDDINQNRRYIYGEDYYLSNMLGVESVSKLIERAIGSGKLNIDTDFSDVEGYNEYLFGKKKIDLLKCINWNGLMYKDATAKKFNSIETRFPDDESKVRWLLKNAGNYLIRDFLNLYGKKEIYDYPIVSEDYPRKEWYSYSFKEKKGDSIYTNYSYLVDVNGKHVPDSKLKIVEDKQYNFIKIPGECLENGANRIHIKEYKFEGNGSSVIENVIVKPEEIKDIPFNGDELDDREFLNNSIDELKAENEQLEFNLRMATTEADKETIRNQITENNELIQAYKDLLQDYRYQITFPKFISATDIVDYIALKKSINEKNIYYNPNYPDDFGWRLLDGVTFVENTDDTITALFREKPEDDILIYCKRFGFKYTKVLNNDISELKDISIPIEASSELRIPVIPSGGYEVYLNGERLFNGIDYVFRHPGNYSLIAYTSLALKRKTKKGDTVTIYFNPIKNETVDRTSDIISYAGVASNKYGLIYFGGLNFPYSPRYVDLYINGKYIYPDQIEILSDKLVRVDPEILNPMFDIFAETSFNVDVKKLQFYFDYEGNKYEDSDFEKAIGELFVDYDFSRITDPDEDSESNKVYESFDSNVDPWDSIEQMTRPGETEEERKEVASQYVPKRYSLYENAYLLWLKSASVKTIVKPSENIRQDVINFFKFYIEEGALGERYDIVASSSRTKLFKDICLSARNYPIKKEDQSRELGQYIKINNLHSNMDDKKGGTYLFDFAKEDLPFANVLYPRDFRPVLSSRTSIGKVGRDIVLGHRSSKIFQKHVTNGGQ